MNLLEFTQNALMASPTPESHKKPGKPSGPAQTSHVASEVVDPVWLIKAFAVVVMVAFICGYLTLCLLFYQGQWQLVLHPSRSSTAPAAIAGTPIQVIRFGVDESATPQLTGWWIPAEPSARYAAYTLLYIPRGDGSLADSQLTLNAFHTLGINVFAFDYRGYGQSAPVHPNQQRMTQDAASAWQYLTTSRAIPANRLVLFGDGVGSFLGAQLAAQHPEVPAVILDSPRPDLLDVVLADPRVKSLPVRSLFHERFDIAQAVKTLATPKLFFLDEPSSATVSSSVRSLVDGAASPKMVVHLTAADRADAVYSVQLTRFLDEYLP